MPAMDALDLAREIAAAETKLADLTQRRAAVAERLTALRETRVVASCASAADERPSAVWAPMRKVELFRSLFRGRDDVFAVRWESERTQRSGYSPKCANEWDRRVCDKPRVRCGVCPSQAFPSPDAAAALDHLQGRAVMGIYPLLPDETCWLPAIDLDGDRWPSDVAALRAAAAPLGVVPAVERSRSGAGAHAWFFFSASVPAVRARALGTLLLTRAMTRTPTLTMDSYDRLFPSQDTMPAGGFGNLIALPLQHEARQRGNTLFLDEQLEPHSDQWAFLASLPRIAPDRLESLVAKGRGGAGVLGVAEVNADGPTPWRPARPLATRLADTPLPATVAATLAQRLYIERDGLTSALLDAVRRLAVFANPLFTERQAMRMSTALTPRVIACFEDLAHHLALPRGCVDDLRELLADLGVALDLCDERTDGEPVASTFTGTLTDVQARAADDLLAHEIGVLCAPPGSGKTVMGARLIAARGRSTLVLVHRKPLVEQWLARLCEFLDLDPTAIGIIGGGRNTPTGRVDIATVQTLARADFDLSGLARYGHVIVDECHHVPAVSVERVLAACPARYVTGLTATPYRRDGHQPIIAMQCGPVRHTIGSQPDTDLALRVVRRDTAFDPAVLPDEPGIQEIYSASRPIRVASS
jgi:hypothetical protein